MIKFYYLVAVHELCINNLSATYVSYVMGMDAYILHYYIGWIYFSVCDYCSGRIKLY